MILNFTVSNYRSIKEPQTLSFEATKDTHLEDFFVVKEGKYRILKIASILGANASGKSNMIRSYSLFSKLILFPCDNKTDKIEYDKFALDEEMSAQDSVFSINFLCNEARYYYEVHFNNDMVCYEQLRCQPFKDMREHKVYERNTDKETMFSIITTGSKYAKSPMEKLSTNLLHNRTVFGAFQKSNVDIPWMKSIVDWVGSYCMPMVTTLDQGLRSYTTSNIIDRNISKRQISTLLKKADVGINDFLINKEEKPLPPHVVELILKDKDAPKVIKEQIREHPVSEDMIIKMIHQGAQKGFTINYDEESRGTQRYYELSGVLMRLINSPHCVAIDELENSLHPDLYEHFIVTFLSNAKKSQLFFTTHMREFLSNRDLFRDDSVWFTQKNEFGETELYSLADFGTDVLRNVSSRYNAYRSGRLGAIPHLGDTFVEQLKSSSDE